MSAEALAILLKRPVSEFAREEIIRVDESETVSNAAKKMRERRETSVLVTRRGEPIGIVTEKDIVYRLVAESRDPNRVPLKQIMSTPLLTIPNNATVEQAIALMAQKNVRRLVVIRDTQILGLITRMSVVGDLRSQIAPLATLEPRKGSQCPYCGSIFPDRDALSKHIDRTHIGSGLLEGDVRKW